MQSLSLGARALEKALAVSALIGANEYSQPDTSVKFPVTVPGEKGSLHLMGAALRAKKIVLVSVQVYAVGLYADKAAVAAKLSPEVRIRAIRARKHARMRAYWRKHERMRRMLRTSNICFPWCMAGLA